MARNSGETTGEAPRCDLVLSSRYSPAKGGRLPRYELRLDNHSAVAVDGFRLGVSCPALIGGALSGGTIVGQLSNWREVAPPPGFVLAPGQAWTIKADDPDLDMRHWTDGVTGAMIILADGSAAPLRVEPPTLAESAEAPRRGVIALRSATETTHRFSISPWPNAVDLEGARPPPSGLFVTATEGIFPDVARTFCDLTRSLFPGEVLGCENADGGLSIILRGDPETSLEGYRILFTPNGAVVFASNAPGALYGLITLSQLVRGARLSSSRFDFPASGVIEDSPTHEWRGCHLDAARRFYAVGDIARFLRIMAWNKLNRFHWHLSDDEGWRLEIEAFPELTAIGAWRGHGLPMPPLLGDGPERSGGFYAKAEVRALTTLGARLGVDIVPEIDVPGHCHALITALPNLRDPDESGRYSTLQGFSNNCINPGVAGVLDVLDDIFMEVCALFPSRYVHIGADEVSGDAWRTSPRAQRLLASIGGRGAPHLTAYMVKRLQQLLGAHGKITGAWDDAAEQDAINRDGAYVVSWRSSDAARALTARGYDVVLSPGQAYYLDMANGPDWAEPGAHWAGHASPEQVFAFQPGENWSETERAHMLGVQACIWSEPMCDSGVFDRLVFPRLSAIADAAWTAPERRCFGRFSALAAVMPTLFGAVAEG